MKKFTKEHKIIVLFIAMISLLVIVVTLYFSVLPKNHIKLINITENEYCSDLSTAYDSGDDITKYKNVLKLSEIQDNLYDKYYITCSVNPISDALPTSNVRIVEGCETKVKAELYILTNFDNNKMVESIFAERAEKAYGNASDSGGVTRNCFLNFSRENRYVDDILVINNGVYGFKRSTKWAKPIIQYLLVISHQSGVVARYR